jgi:hypothetical protein
MRRMIRYVVR